ncbi:MAG TPA: ABC transporter ATP-binding protein [Armatimonadetes bacterium]|nr:ABC transporter ATP-binding protein [Armatimonadota bacterium]
MVKPQAVIQVEDLAYTVNGRPVLRGVSLSVQEGEIVSIMGPSGCGKTTFLKCLAGLLRPTRGHIYLEGRDIVGLSEEELNQVRRHLGLVFQYAALFDSLTVAENIAFPLRRFTRLSEAEIAARVREKLALVGLEGIENYMPAELSGGMRKRVGLARALAAEPRIILYDEPTSGLDPISAANIDALIVGMRDRLRVTSVIVSHHIQDIFRISDRVAMLHGGKFIALGTPAEMETSTDPVVQQFITASAEGPLTDVEINHAGHDRV